MIITTALLILMKAKTWYSLRQETSKKIMNTDILCEVMYSAGQKNKAEKCLEEAFAMMRKFEIRYSRFKKNNELWKLNQSTERTVSQELFNILSGSQYFYSLTDGLFDPSILPALEKEGYASTPYNDTASTPRKKTLSQLHLDSSALTAIKPRDLFIDLGGIGKGYIVDQVTAYLSLHFDNFIIDAGGDIYARGTNKKEDYPYWVVEIEHPDAENTPVALLLLKDMAVATSGRNRRHWIKDQQNKHHIIDPRTNKSASPDFLSVTVIAASTISADVLAKFLFIAGREKAYLLAEKFRIPAIFIESRKNISINHYAEPYVWKA